MAPHAGSGPKDHLRRLSQLGGVPIFTRHAAPRPLRHNSISVRRSFRKRVSCPVIVAQVNPASAAVPPFARRACALMYARALAGASVEANQSGLPVLEQSVYGHRGRRLRLWPIRCASHQRNMDAWMVGSQAYESFRTR